jgi:regulator of G-protein signaling
MLDLLSDVTGRYKFEEFCKKQFCLENIRFWQACRDLKTLPLIAVNGSVKLIYE